ncbi:MAG: methyltransferase domain-containing protein [Anaerolineales bacterium]
MKPYVGPAPLYNFLRTCESSPLEKVVLDCGAGGPRPPLALFAQQGYEAHGVELSEERLRQAQDFARASALDLHLLHGDLRALPYTDTSISFAYTFNTIFHLPKEEMARGLQEIARVLKPGGLCFANLLSVDDGEYGAGEEVGPGEFLQEEHGGKSLHSYFEDDEADGYFEGWSLLRREKRVLQLWVEGTRYPGAMIDYIVRKPH